MYRHAAESIKETSSRNFISQTEKDKYNNYEIIMRSVEDSYNKEEVDNKIKELSDNTYGDVESTYVSEANTIDGHVKDLEILGNTIQNQDDLSDIKSVGELQEDGTYKMSILSHGKNLFDKYSHDIVIGKALGLHNGLYDDDRYFSSGLIPVKPNTVYKYTCVEWGWYCDENGLKLDNGPSGVITTPSNCHYIRFSTKITYIDNVQIEEGTIDTSYEPYKESRVDINLPCQLEKVGDVSDRLYYDEKEKAWCIEKNIGEVVLNGTENWWIEPSTTIGNRTKFVCETFIDVLPPLTDVCITNKFVFNNDGPYESCRISPSMKRIVFNTNTSNNITDFKEKISANNIIVKYATSTPEKIILPLSTQIQLNSYADRTHIYMVSGEVEPTIKATLPKSLGGSVQTLNDKTDMMIDRIEAIETLKEGQNLSYESDKGFVVCENTNNGQIDNIKIEGRTLVNLLIDSDNDIISSTNAISKNYRYLERGKTYTAVTFVIENNNNKAFHPFRVTYSDNSFTGAPKEVHRGGTVNTFKFTLEDKDIKAVWVNWCAEYVEGDIITTKTLLLEGDHTSNYPSHFEGLMSIGGDVDEIEVLSRKEDGNLFDCQKYSSITKGVSNFKLSGDGFTYSASKNYSGVNYNYKFKFNIGEKYTIAYKGHNARIIYTNNNNNISTPGLVYNGETKFVTFITNEKSSIVRIENGELGVCDVIVEGIWIYKGDYDETKHTPIVDNSKSLLYYNDLGELVPVPELHEWDSIEKHSDGKWYYHKRSEKVVLNGSEGWYLNNESVAESNTLAFYIPTKPKAKNLLGIICDLFHTDINIFKMDYECIRISSDQSASIYIRINKSRLSSENVAGFKSWLSSNNVTVVYELAEEQVYECVNLNLDTYDNETMVMINTGAISPNLSFNVSSHIGNTVSILRERLKAIEESFTEDRVLQNTFQLNTMYSSDKLVFNVNIYACSINEYDEDLFTLITEVLLAGKDNYNLAKMEEIIDFYTMIGKLSFDMADVLFEIIENQINPPVIEIPEEEIEILPEI